MSGKAALTRKNTPNRACDIAIVGLSGRFPGGANSPEELWDLLESGRDGVGEITGDRWDLSWHNPDQDRKDRIYARSFGQLDQIEGFDADFFGISPREARQIDPQQRLLLELTWEVFEDAGISPRSVAGQNIGVYIGISSNDYSMLAADGGPDAYSNTGGAFSIAANRLSYVFDLHGPSFAVDTACSSSLVCLHQAAQAVQNGECEAAIAGGVSILMHTRPWLGFSRASMLSPDGRCKSFDASGNGYVRSEGGGLVLLKPLADAEAANDPILGVLRATGINSDGRTLGLSMPNGDAQTTLLQELYSEAGISPERVFYVEAHGTGTSVGDPIECGSLGKVLGTPRNDGSLCNIGSVKSNIGHLEPASGIAGLAKLLLSLKHRKVPANLHFNDPNPKIEFDSWKLNVVDEALPLPAAPVVMGINSFGFGGTNAHAIIEEYRKPEIARVPATPTHLILSASSDEALRDLAASYETLLRAPDADFAVVAHGAATCRASLRLRLVVAADTALEAADKLEAWRTDQPRPGTATGSSEPSGGATAFVYSGNGPQWWGMGRELLGRNATFRAKIQEIDALFAPLSGWSLLDEMARPESEDRTELTEVAQPMLFALQMALTEVLQEANITPSAVLGHSVGEVAAACASGALTLQEATRVIYHRSREQAATAGVGKMAALGLDAEAARAEMAKIGGWLEIAAINGPAAVTVAGNEDSLRKLVDAVSNSGQFARLLRLNYPFHTLAMDRIRDGLVSGLSDLAPRKAQVPFMSTVKAELVEGEDLTATYWFDNVRQPVNFHGAVSHLMSQHEVALFIEIGPHPVLKDYVAQTARADNATAIVLETLRRPGKDQTISDEESLATAISGAMANGAVPLDRVFLRPQQVPDLPKYPWQRTRHWRGHVALPDSFVPTQRVHPLLGARLPATDGKWEVVIDKSVLTYLADHMVQDSILFPAAGYIEMMLAAGRQLWGSEGVIDIEDCLVLRPLVLTDQADPIVQTVVDSRDGTVEISSRRTTDATEQQIHVRGRLSVCETAPRLRREDGATAPELTGKIDAAEHYVETLRRGLQYGPLFQGLQSLSVTDSAAATQRALAVIRLDFLKEGGLESYRAHPSLLDSCIQALVGLITQIDPRNVTTVPISFAQVRSYAPLPAELLCHVTLVSDSPRSSMADFTMTDMDGNVVLELTGARCRKANLTGETASPLISEWWRPDTKVAKTGSLPALPALADAVPEKPFQTVRHDILDSIADAYAVQALHQLRPPEPSFTMSSFARHARIGRAQGPLLTQMIATAVASGHLTEAGKSWAWTDKPLADANELWAEAFRNLPCHQAELLLLAETGESLAPRLKGADAAEPNAALLEQIYDTSPLAAEANGLVCAALRSLIDTWPQARPMRILEIGGGSGGLTSWLLPMLPAEDADYLLTGSSEASIARAERRLSRHRFLRAQPLDLSRNLSDQGLADGYFDLVIASGLESMADRPEAILERLQPVMGHGAMILALARHGGRSAQMLYGLQQSIDESLLNKSGFSGVTTLSQGATKLLVGTASRVALPDALTDIAGEALLIVAEEVGVFAEDLAAELEKFGHSVTTTSFPDTPGEAATDGLQATLNASGAARVVLLGHSQPGAPLAEVQVRRTMVAANLTAAMERVRQDRPVGLTVVTRGAFQTSDGRGPVDPAEAALWGIGRVICNEHAGLDLRLIDMHGDDARTLALELSRRDDETEVQLAHGHRYVNREQVTTPSDEARHAGLRADAFTLDFVPSGGLDSLHLRHLTRKDPTGDEVEIAVKAAGLNFRDVLWCMGMLPEEAVEHGFSGPTIGMECAGEVLRVGPDVAGIRPGDRVMAFASSCFGTHVTTAAKSVAPLPEAMDYAEAATVPTVFLTAWYGLDYLARLEPGETILIHGAAGGVGLAAVQIAKLKGAVVIGTAGAPSKRRMLERLGVDHVLDSRSLRYADEIMDLTDGKGVDVILNSLAGEAILKNLRILRPFGRFLEIGKRDLYENSRIGLRPFRNNLSYFGIDADTLLIERPALAQRMFREVIEQFASGRLTALPHQVLPISRASEAFRAMQQSRHVGKLVISMERDRPEDLYVVQSRGQVRPGGTYLVTGGLAGFGLSAASWLIDQGADTLALISRSGAATEEARSAIAAFEAAGVTVRVFAADVSDAAALEGVLTKIREELPPLIGVIHSAAVIEDAPIMTMAPDQVERVFGAKMIGARNLHDATLGDPIEMFVLFSSVSAVVGNPGQGAYVAANLYLDALAQHRRALGLPGLSVGWGAILDAGFLTRNKDVRDMLKTRTGLDATPAQEALADLERLLCAGASRVCVARIDLSRLQQMLPAARSPRFAPILPDTAADALKADETLADLLAAMPREDQRAFILERLLESTARVLGTKADQINPQQALGDLGLDSLMAVELAGSLEQDVGQSVPVMQLLGADSLAAVADFLATLLGVDADNAGDGPGPVDEAGKDAA